MNIPRVVVLPVLALLFAGVATAAVTLEGEVALDYYVAEVDAEGYERVEMEFYAEAVTNHDAGRSGPLSLGGWLTRDPSPGGAGIEAAYLPLGTVPGRGAVEVWDAADADDVPPGEYYVHALLQDDRFPGSYEDGRSLSPRLLWRGGLEAVGPLRIYAWNGGRDIEVAFDRLHNNRRDGRFTNDIRLTLYATYGFGPASDGYDLCTAIVPGLYAGDSGYHADFTCAALPVPDGEYTLHLMVEEIGGRGGHSTLAGPDAYFRDGRLHHLIGAGGEHVHYAGGLGPWLAALLLASLARRLRIRRRGLG